MNEYRKVKELSEQDEAHFLEEVYGSEEKQTFEDSDTVITKFPEIVPGAVVRLNSGSPAMTVRLVDISTFAHCEWFIDGILQSHSFKLSSLQLDSKYASESRQQN